MSLIAMLLEAAGTQGVDSVEGEWTQRDPDWVWVDGVGRNSDQGRTRAPRRPSVHGTATWNSCVLHNPKAPSTCSRLSNWGSELLIQSKQPEQDAEATPKPRCLGRCCSRRLRRLEPGELVK